MVDIDADGATVDEVVGAMAADGYCIVAGILTRDEVAAARASLVDVLEATPGGRNSFEGFGTQRVYALVRQDPRLRRAGDAPAGARRPRPGAGPLPARRHRPASRSGRVNGPRRCTSTNRCTRCRRDFPTVVVNTMWALDDFTEANGATRIIPGQPPLGRSPARREADEVLQAVMPAGSVMFYVGRVWHGGGANRTTSPASASSWSTSPRGCGRRRTTSSPCPARSPPTLPERLQELLGYNIYPPFLGYVDGRHPRRYITELAPTPAPVVER